MGLFSWDCRGCGHPLLHNMGATNDVNDWMNDVVILNPDGSRIEGSYDGYGRVERPTGPTFLAGIGMGPCAWHRACWEIAGEPDEYVPSASSDDQGHFFEEGAHDMADPRLQYQEES
jgi:hypothetical protein